MGFFLPLDPPNKFNNNNGIATRAKGGRWFLSALTQFSARPLASWMPGVMDNGLRWSEAWLANLRPLVGMMTGLLLLACRCMPIVVVVA
jgi:hypothetical protein